jgi:hypothetical protein
VDREPVILARPRLFLRRAVPVYSRDVGLSRRHAVVHDVAGGVLVITGGTDGLPGARMVSVK